LDSFNNRSTCKECGCYTDTNNYGYCKLCVEERTQRIIRNRSQQKEAKAIGPLTFPFSNVQGSRPANNSPSYSQANSESEPHESDVNSTRIGNTATVVQNDGTVAEIHVNYGRPHVAWTRKLTRERLTDDERSTIVERLFTLNKEKKRGVSNYVHTEEERINVFKNILLLQIDIQYGKQFTRTISGGNYDFVGGSKTGYLVSLRVESDDDFLLKTAVTVMRKLSFACYPSNFTAYCFLEHAMPTLAEQRELLITMCNNILTEVLRI
jgi:hypothetical protein